MLKAPFRFDIQYFSLLVVYRKSFYDTRHYFKDSSDKKDYLLKIKKQGERLSAKQLKDIEENNCYLSTVETPAIYLFICNNKNNQLFASLNRYEEICEESKLVLQSIFDVYSYLRKFCDSDRVKMTVKGNLLMNYEQDEKQYKFKIENYPISFKTYVLDEMWDSIVDSWTNRKDQEYEEDVSFYSSKIEKGTLSLIKNKRQKNEEKLSNPKRSNFINNHQSRDVESIQIVDSNSQQQKKQRQTKLKREDTKAKPEQGSDQQNQQNEAGAVGYQSGNSSSYRLDNKKQSKFSSEKNQEKSIAKQNQINNSHQQKDSQINSYYSSQQLSQILERSEDLQKDMNQQRGQGHQDVYISPQNQQNTDKFKPNISKQISEDIIKTIRDEIRAYLQAGPSSQKIISSITEYIDNKYEHLLLDIKNQTKKIINKIQQANSIKNQQKTVFKYRDQQLKIQNQKTDKNYNRKDVIMQVKTFEDKKLKKNHLSRISQEVLSNVSKQQRDDLKKAHRNEKKKYEKEYERLTNLMAEQPKREQMKKRLISKGGNK